MTAWQSTPGSACAAGGAPQASPPSVRTAVTATALAGALIAAFAPHGPILAQALPSAAASALRDGRSAWLRYDSQAHQIAGCEDLAPSLDSASSVRPNPAFPPMVLHSNTAMQLLHQQIALCPRPSPTVGRNEYDRAENRFRAAYDLAPTHPATFHNLAMLLAERQRWRELEQLAREHTTRAEWNAWGWLALGLAQHRLGAGSSARAAFDSGTARLEASERARLFSLARLLQRRDSALHASRPADARRDAERDFWIAADPLWSRDGNDAHTEFLARVTFAELRWTVEERNVRGADSDRGEAYIRFGPPNVILAMRGSAFSGTPIGEMQQVRPGRGGRLAPQTSDVVTWWDYASGIALVFWGAPTYGTARFPTADGEHIETVIEARSAAFDNVATERIVQLPAFAARFRGDGDSVDVVLAVQAPVQAIRADAPSSTAVRGDFWLIRDLSTVEARDSSALRESGVAQHTFRVPAGQYGYRVEATAPGSNVAARALGRITAQADSATGFALRGFGMSDVILAAVAEPANTPVERWYDYAVAPLFGVIPRHGQLALVWETYDLQGADGRAEYSVSVTLARVRSGSGRIAASLLGTVGAAVGVDRRDDRVTFAFDRAVRAAPAIADHVTVSIGDTPAGDYRLSVEIRDRRTGRATSRTALLTIAR